MLSVALIPLTHGSSALYSILKMLLQFHIALFPNRQFLAIRQGRPIASDAVDIHRIHKVTLMNTSECLRHLFLKISQ